jgi:hypothetical protein
VDIHLDVRGVLFLPGNGIPKLDAAIPLKGNVVVAHRHQNLAVCSEREVADNALMSDKTAQLLAGRWVPKANDPLG